MNGHSESMDFVMDFCMIFFLWMSWGLPSLLNEGQKIHWGIHSKIHDKIPAKSTRVVKSGAGKSTLQEKGSDNPAPEKILDNLVRNVKDLIVGPARPESTKTLLLPNGLTKDKEVKTPPLETPCFPGQNSIIALFSTSLNEEALTSLSYLSHVAATGKSQSQIAAVFCRNVPVASQTRRQISQQEGVGWFSS